MIKSLYVGDPHFKHTQKDEMERLMHFVRNTANDNKVSQIVILGDLNDTFGVLRTENLYFWEKWLKLLSENQNLFVLTGNHDKKNQGDDNDYESSLSIFKLIDSKNLFIIETPMVAGPFAYVPYIHDKKLFVERANSLKECGANVLVCHNEFDGGAYDNGFFIKDGVKPEDLNYDLVISGHIHTKSAIGKVRHPGAPRWMNSSDANKEKGIWLVEHDYDTGAILKEEFLSTAEVCTPIYAYQFKEGETAPKIPEGSRASVELVGSSEWISKQKPLFKGIASISSKITDKQKPKNRKVENGMEQFVLNYCKERNLDSENFVGFMKELGVL